MRNPEELPDVVADEARQLWEAAWHDSAALRRCLWPEL